jgi:hypothetical protein
LAYQPPVSSTFLSEQTNQQPAGRYFSLRTKQISTANWPLLFSQQNKSAQPNELSRLQIGESDLISVRHLAGHWHSRPETGRGAIARAIRFRLSALQQQQAAAAGKRQSNGQHATPRARWTRGRDGTPLLRLRVVHRARVPALLAPWIECPGPRLRDRELVVVATTTCYLTIGVGGGVGVPGTWGRSPLLLLACATPVALCWNSELGRIAIAKAASLLGRRPFGFEAFHYPRRWHARNAAGSFSVKRAGAGGRRTPWEGGRPLGQTDKTWRAACLARVLR